TRLPPGGSAPEDAARKVEADPPRIDGERAATAGTGSAREPCLPRRSAPTTTSGQAADSPLESRTRALPGSSDGSPGNEPDRRKSRPPVDRSRTDRIGPADARRAALERAPSTIRGVRRRCPASRPPPWVSSW